MPRRRLESADLMLITANVLWSFNYATTKYAFGAWEPLAFAVSRFAMAGILFSIVVLVREGSMRVHRSDVPLVLAAAAVGILGNQLTFNYAVENTTAGAVALILASAPAFAALFAMLAGHEHVSAPALVRALGLGGRGGAGDRGRQRPGRREPARRPAGGGGGDHLGRLLGDAAAAVRALLLVADQRPDGGDRGRDAAALRPAPAAQPGLVVADPARLGAWAYSAIFPLLVTNLLYFRSLRLIGASRATLYMYLQPFLGALFAAWLLGETVTVLQIVGGLVIVGGVSLGQLMPGATVRE